MCIKVKTNFELRLFLHLGQILVLRMLQAHQQHDNLLCFVRRVTWPHACQIHAINIYICVCVCN
jgi:hypothetical protein